MSIFKIVPTDDGHKSFSKKLWGQVVDIAVILFLLGEGVNFTLSAHPLIADAFYLVSGVLFIAKFFTWEDAKQRDKQRRRFLAIAATVIVLAGAIAGNHYLNAQIVAKLQAPPPYTQMVVLDVVQTERFFPGNQLCVDIIIKNTGTVFTDHVIDAALVFQDGKPGMSTEDAAYKRFQDLGAAEDKEVQHLYAAYPNKWTMGPGEARSQTRCTETPLTPDDMIAIALHARIMYLIGKMVYNNGGQETGFCRYWDNPQAPAWVCLDHQYNK